jgi:MoaA/NifB/PqqE/SkfB family radical SAM enzyme
MRVPESTSRRGFLPDERCRFRPLRTDGLRVIVRLTRRCNLYCPHCLSASAGSSEELDFQGWREVLRELPRVHARKVLLTGGEPLLHPDLVPIVDWISALNIPVDLNSNLQTLSDGMLQELKDAGLTEISVSLEGPREIHDQMHGMPGAFDRVVDAIHRCAAKGVAVDVSCCLTTWNQGHLDELLKIARELPILSLTFSRLIPIGHGKKCGAGLPQAALDHIYERILTEYAEDSPLPIRSVGLLNPPDAVDCPRGQSLICLSPDGRVVGCVLAEKNPEGLPHPKRHGLAAAVEALRNELNLHAYDRCWSLE